jgi:hypothetical protein
MYTGFHLPVVKIRWNELHFSASVNGQCRLRDGRWTARLRLRSHHTRRGTQVHKEYCMLRAILTLIECDCEAKLVYTRTAKADYQY